MNLERRRFGWENSCHLASTKEWWSCFDSYFQVTERSIEAVWGWTLAFSMCHPVSGDRCWQAMEPQQKSNLSELAHAALNFDFLFWRRLMWELRGVPRNSPGVFQSLSNSQAVLNKLYLLSVESSVPDVALDHWTSCVKLWLCPWAVVLGRRSWKGASNLSMATESKYQT